ncbi:MAG: thioredoxin [Erysipelotrichales bacterium]
MIDMALLKLDDTNFSNEIATGVTLVDFYADWCGPCKMVAPIVEQIANEVEGVKVAKIDVDKAQATAQKYNVMSIPTLIVFKDGQPVDVQVGFAAKEQIEAMINKAK